MARQALTDCAYFVGSLELTGQSNRVSFDAMVEELECTTFGSGGNREYVGGLESVSISGGGFIDLANVYDVEQFHFDNRRELVPHTIGVSNSGSAVAAKAYLTKALDTSLKAGNDVGQLFGWELSATGSAKSGYGKFLWSPATAVTSTADGTAVEIGAIPDGKHALATLHVLARSGSAALTAVLESDADADFDGSETARISFTQASGVGSQFGSVAGPITDTHWRAALTVSGTGSLTIAIAVGVSLFAV